MEGELVQMIFLGNPSQMDRIEYLLRRNIPHKIYFFQSMEGADDEERERISVQMRKDIENQLPKWIVSQSEHMKIPFFDFSVSFPKILSIMSKEKKKGRNVIVNVHGGTIMLTTAAILAANLTGSRVLYVNPEKWEVKEFGKNKTYIPVGADEPIELKIPIDISLPKGPAKHVLTHIHKKGGIIKGRLSSMAQDIGLDNLGANVKKSSSGTVKLSKIVSKLREEGYVETKKLGRKSFFVSLTSGKGKIIGEVLSLLGDEDGE